jgi:hypothetical protein
MSKLSRLVGAAAVLGLLAAVPEAHAAQPEPEPGTACADHGEVVRKLADRFGETRTGIGLHREDAVVEVFSSARTGTWTIVLTGPDGLACLLAAGQRWEQMPAPVADVIPGQGA